MMGFISFVVCRSITADSCYFDEDRIGALTTKSGTLTEDSILVINQKNPDFRNNFIFLILEDVYSTNSSS